jgi:hypothetical protein
MASLQVDFLDSVGLSLGMAAEYLGFQARALCDTIKKLSRDNEDASQ